MTSSSQFRPLAEAATQGEVEAPGQNGDTLGHPPMTSPDLEKLLADVPAGPYQYRPFEYDDWGVIRAADGQPVADVCRAAQYTLGEALRARETRTIPPRVEALGKLFSQTWTNARDLITARERIAELEAETARLTGVQGQLCEEIELNEEEDCAKEADFLAMKARADAAEKRVAEMREAMRQIYKIAIEPTNNPNPIDYSLNLEDVLVRIAAIASMGEKDASI